MASDNTPSRNGIKRKWFAACVLCDASHPITTCYRFLRLSPEERFKVLTDSGYCINCMARSHTKSVCASSASCSICNAKHHHLIHEALQVINLSETTDRNIKREATREVVCIPLVRDDDKPIYQSPPKPRRLSTQSCDMMKQTALIKTTVDLTSTFNWSKVFVPTAQIRIAIDDEPGAWHMCRVGINKLCTHSRIAGSLVRQLQLTTFVFQDTKFARVQATSRISRFKWAKEICALITNDLPRRPYESPLSVDPTSDYNEHTLADTDPMANTPIEMELGADEYYTLCRDGVQKTSIDYVVAEQTAIGYTFTGPVGDIW